MASHAPGLWTASTISPILTGKDPDKLLVGAVNYCKQIALERSAICDLSLDLSGFSGNDATEWGNTYESEAIERYEEATFSEVVDLQKGVRDGWKSCTPDGYVGQDGLVEIKCPYKSLRHFDNLIEAAWVSEYSDQCQFQMMMTGRKWCDLVSYDPRYLAPHDLVICRIERDQAHIDFMQHRIALAEPVVQGFLDRIKSINAK